MRTPDANLLLYAVNADCAQQPVAATWLEEAFAQAAGIGFAWAAVLGFLRLSTKPGIFSEPLELTDALGIMDEWLNHPNARILNPGERHATLLPRLLTGAGVGGNLASDAHLAAIAIEHGATLGTWDREFERFPGLRLECLPLRSVHEQ